MSGGQNICFCHTCNQEYKSLGIARHRAMHLDNGEDCTITYSSGITMGHGSQIAVSVKRLNAVKKRAMRRVLKNANLRHKRT